MFERFTDPARRAVVLAQEEARLLNHNYIGTEHVLLGLLHEGEDLAAQTLRSLGVDLDATRARVEALIGVGSASPSGHMPFTPRAKKALELSLREALGLGHHFIGTEHLLLGLLREGRGVAAQVLVEMGADLARVRQQVVEIVGTGAPEETATEADDRDAADDQDLVVESLTAEVRRLRRELDRLRDALRRAETGPAPFSPAVLPDLDDPQGEGRETAAPPSGEPPPEAGPSRVVLSCSFCTQPQERVAKLVAGPGVYICDRCIALCQEILDEELGPPETGPAPDDPRDDP